MVAALAAVALALRLGNAETARIHDDELHYGEDALWSIAPLDAAEKLEFLREHAGTHLRLDPVTGLRRPWGGPGEIARLAHPTALQYLLGPLDAALGVPTPRRAAVIGRRVNAIVDASTVVLLPGLVRALGGSAAGGILAAGLYAVFPPAITYGSLYYLDAPLAPLLVLLLRAVLALGPALRSWLRVGVVTGLLLACKQTGLVALVFVPFAALVLGARSRRGLVLWGGSALLVLCLFTDPGAYVAGVLRPSRPVGQLRFAPVSILWGNVTALADPEAYYWLSFARHGAPPAPLLARVHPWLTPAYLAVYALGLVVALGARDVRRLVILYVPAALVLVAIMPSDGLWRLHLLSPLVCAAAGMELAELPRRRGLAALVLAGALVGWRLVPPRPARDGTIDLADLLRANPQAAQPLNFYDARHPLVVKLSPGVTLGRWVYLPAGTYEAAVVADAPIELRIDGQPVLSGGAARGTVTVSGVLHRLELSAERAGTIRLTTLRRVG